MRTRSALLQVLDDHGNHVGEDGFGALLGKVLAPRDSRHQVLQRDGDGRRYLRRHVWPSSVPEANGLGIPPET